MRQVVNPGRFTLAVCGVGKFMGMLLAPCSVVFLSLEGKGEGWQLLAQEPAAKTGNNGKEQEHPTVRAAYVALDPRTRNIYHRADHSNSKLLVSYGSTHETYNTEYTALIKE